MAGFRHQQILFLTDEKADQLNDLVMREKSPQERAEYYFENRFVGSEEEFDKRKRREGHDGFRQALKNIYGSCMVTGILTEELIIASHIKGVRDIETTDEERYDPYNGLWVFAGIDKAFDKHIVSFSDDGSILIPPQLVEELERVGITGEMKLQSVLEKTKPYLAFHRLKFVEKNRKYFSKEI